MKSKIPLDEIVALGFDVYIREPSIIEQPIRYAYFTDGVKIGYIQVGSHADPYDIGSVHRPCKECGTGYSLGGIDKITKDILKGAFAHHPSWASRKDAEAIVKYRDWNEFHNFDKWNQGYYKYEPNI